MNCIQIEKCMCKYRQFTCDDNYNDCYFWFLQFEDNDETKTALQYCAQNLNEDCVLVEKLKPNPFTSLIDDCICLLYNLLQLQDQLNLSMSCYRYEQVYIEYYATKLTQLETENFEVLIKYTNAEIQQYFRCSGKYIESISISFRFSLTDISTALYNGIKEYCINLKRLKMINRVNREYAKFLNSHNLQKITEVDLTDCNLFDSDVKPLTTMPNLEVLGLSHNKVTGKHIMAMRQVKHLNLYQCQAVTQKNFKAICKALNLHFLDIRVNKNLNVNAIVDDCGELEELKYSAGIRSNKFHENILKLRNLKSLVIWDTFEFDAEILKRLLNSLPNHLLELQFTSYHSNLYDLYPRVFASLKNLHNLRTLWLCCINMDRFEVNLWHNLTEIEEINLDYSRGVNRDEEIVSLVRHCRKLKRLSIYAWKLSVNSVKEIILILKCRAEDLAATAKIPQLILAVEKDIHGSVQNYILENPKYSNAHHLACVSLHRRWTLTDDFSILSKSVFEQYDSMTFNETCDKLLVIVGIHII